MPKNKVQDAVFTAIMAIIMVYSMIVYNVALNTGGVTNETFLLALHVFIHEAYRPPAVHHLCRFHLHLLHHVPHHEPDRDHAF